MNEFYDKHKDFNELCDYYNLDKKKIIERFEDVFFEGIRRSGSWEAQVLRSIFYEAEFLNSFIKENDEPIN